MSSQLNFLLNQAMYYIQGGNLGSAELLLKQIIKARPNHSEALRLSAVISAQQGDSITALDKIEKAILADKKNGVAYSSKGNILLALGNLTGAVEAHKKAIETDPTCAESYSNLGNAYQEMMEFEIAISCYERAIAINPLNPEFYSNLGNAYQEMMEFEIAISCYEKAIAINPLNPEFYYNMGNVLWKLNNTVAARRSYTKAVEINSGHANSWHNLAHLDLHEFNFTDGWSEYEVRWLTKNCDNRAALNTSKPRWDGLKKNNRLFIWGEQGIGDQILYGSMFRDLEKYPQSKTISVDKKLIPMFQRSFPSMKFVAKGEDYPEDYYDEQIPIGSLGQFLRPNLSSFESQKIPYLVTSKTKTLDLKNRVLPNGDVLCGLSWKSGRAKFGKNKSIPLVEFDPVLRLRNIKFINLQYGEVFAEISEVNNFLGLSLSTVEGIDLFEDVDSLLSILELCDVVVTSSNSTAHLAGALSKETLLLLPFGHGKFWYWHDVNGVSLWYPSIRIFKQEEPGDWSKPIEAVKAYLENKFAI